MPDCPQRHSCPDDWSRFVAHCRAPSCGGTLPGRHADGDVVQGCGGQEGPGASTDTDYSALTSRELLTKGLDELKISLTKRRAAAAADQQAATAVVRARDAAAAAKAAERQAAAQQVCPSAGSARFCVGHVLRVMSLRVPAAAATESRRPPQLIWPA